MRTTVVTGVCSCAVLLVASCAAGGDGEPVARAPGSTPPSATTAGTATAAALATIGVIPQRPATAVERAALDSDGGGLVCDTFGAGAAQWDYGPIGADDQRGRLAVDALRDALDELNADAVREGADPAPADGWTELVIDAGSSAFVLDVDGTWRGVVRVSGDSALGVWRHTDADLCNSLFVPDGATVLPPPSSVAEPASTMPRASPVTTAPDGSTVPRSPVGTVEWLPPGEPPPPIAANEDVYVLMVSNQSVVDATVRLVISVEGQQIIDESFEVRDQHTVTTYLLRDMRPGRLRLDVVGDTGVETSRLITAPAGAPQWAYLTYWNNGGDSPSVQLVESDEPILLD